MAVHALFGMLHDSGVVMGAFEIERVFDWELSSRKDSIRAGMGTLTGLVGMVKREAKPPRDDRKMADTPQLPPQYPSSVGSDSRIESSKRMQTPGHPPQIMQVMAVSTQAQTPSSKDDAVPNAWEGAIIRLMQSVMMRTTDVPIRTEPPPTFKATPQATTSREPVEVAMEFVCSQTTPRSKRQALDQDEDPEDLLDLETGTPGTAAAVSPTRAGTGLTRVRLSAFFELKKLHGRDVSVVNTRAWFNRAKFTSRRDGMTGGEVWAPLGDLMAGWTVRVFTPHKTWVGLFQSKEFQDRLSQWAAGLSPWRPEFCRSVNGEEKILGTRAVIITLRKFVGAALEAIAARQRPSPTAVIPVPSVAPDEKLHVMSFGESAKAQREHGTSSAVVWKPPW
ncbi:unnamed protein product [Phytophthora fragariaefolia]|uniref:Unnamed protein product n=1 Tax=Phytophthora fragariaefolia TaxID=1490495 RepID=A0A9W6XCB2_9STRA|nr:unnamed protein product [Phytophthora fragariaefolia]